MFTKFKFKFLFLTIILEFLLSTFICVNRAEDLIGLFPALYMLIFSIPFLFLNHIVINFAHDIFKNIFVKAFSIIIIPIIIYILFNDNFDGVGAMHIIVFRITDLMSVLILLTLLNYIAVFYIFPNNKLNIKRDRFY
jgi:hypothetical protein